MRFTGSVRTEAERQVRSAVAVAALSGILSLIVGVQTWDDRRHLDLEILIGLADSLVVLGLAYALSRYSLSAAWLLVAISTAGALYTLAGGAPVLAILPNLIVGGLVARSIGALRFLRRSAVAT